MARILILGGGFGGLAAAHELRRGLDGEHEIVLVDRRDRFAMGFAKLWDLAGIRPIEQGTRMLSGLEAHGIRFLQTAITAVDPGGPTVATEAGELHADAMLVALGADDHPDHVAALDRSDAAHNLYDAAALRPMKHALAGLDGGQVLVAVLGQPFKCPPAPFEAVLLIDEHLRDRGTRNEVELTIATPAPSALPVAGPEASKFVADALADRRITLLTEHLVADVDGSARFTNGDEVAFDLLLGVPGAVPPAVVRDSALSGDDGWIRPDPRTLRTSFDRVYAVGDCTTVPTATAALPKAGVFAAGEAVAAARNIAADLGFGEEATFDGHGFCYLEFPGRLVAMVEGAFFADPEPDVAMTEPTEDAYRAKVAFERDHLFAWLAGSG